MDDPFILSAEYAAGFFDADGFVSVRFSEANKVWYRPLVGISQYENDGTLEAFERTWGGSIYYGERYTRWQIAKPEPMIEFIEEILPHTWKKRERLSLTLKLAQTGVGLRGKYMTRSIIEQRKSIADEIKGLQEKGCSSYTNGFKRTI